MTNQPAGADVWRDVRTIGVAIPIPEPYGQQLQDWRRAFGDPMADAIPPHITLIPPTEISYEDHFALEEHLAGVAAARDGFVVQLRGAATFRPVSPVVFVALARGISDCETLSTAVRTGPLEVALRFPYHPHVTVAHYLSDDAMDHAFATLADYEADFVVDTFGLYEHGPDGVWHKQRTFLLGRPEERSEAGAGVA